MPRTLAWTSCLIPLAVLCGCSGALGPTPMPTTRLSGHVLLDGKPVGPMWLEMLPADGTVGRLRSAPVKADGSFTVDGVPVGRVAIRLAGRPFPPSGDPRLDSFLRTARRLPVIRLETPAGENRPVVIKLRDQMIAFERLYGSRS